jgi:aspartate beta-hydroxylase
MQASCVHSPFLFIPSLRERGPFFGERIRSKLPWLAAFEQATPAIAAELHALLESKEPFPEFFGSWHTYDFFLYGKFFPFRARQCPTTFELLTSASVIRNSQCGFSRLAAEDAIGAHSDAHCTNLRLRVHIPLVCVSDTEAQFLNVGGQVRGWEIGKALLLDTCYQHSATNKLEEDRYVLLFDVHHPELGKGDIEALNKLDQFFVY